MTTQHQSSRALPTLALVFGILAVSMAAILVRWANAPATVIGFFRMTIAATVMALPFARAARQANIAPGQLSVAVIAGTFFGLNLWAWNSSAQITTAANVTLLGNLSVVWVPLAAMFLFKRRLRRAFWVGLVCALAGVLMILGQDLLAHPALGFGDLLAIVASFVYSVYMLTMERARAGLSALVAWWISTMTSALVLLVLTLGLNAPLVGYPVASYAIFAIMAIVIQIGGFLSLNYAQGHLSAPIVSASMLAQPVLTALLAVPLLGQSVGLVQVVGGALVLGGIFIVHRSRF